MRKNLDASKRKLADKTNAADKLQKTLTQARAENGQLEQTIKELEAQLEEAKSEPDSESQGRRPLNSLPVSSYSEPSASALKASELGGLVGGPSYSAGVGRE